MTPAVIFGLDKLWSPLQNHCMNYKMADLIPLTFVCEYGRTEPYGGGDRSTKHNLTNLRVEC